MKKIKRAVAAMTAGLLCLAGTPTLPAEIQRTILLNANAADDVAADENAWYLRDGLSVSVVLAPGEQKQLVFKCRRLNENNYYSYSEIGYNEISQYTQISSDYDESLIQLDEETGYITAVEGTDGGTTQFTIEDAQGNVQKVNVRVVGRDLEIVGMHVQSDNYYFLDGSGTQYIDVYLGRGFRISYDYYTGYPDYEFVKDTYLPDLCEEVTYDDYYISFDKETGVFEVYGGESEIVITGSNGFEQKLNVSSYIDATTTRASTTTTTSTTTEIPVTETTTTSATEAEEKLSDFEVVIDQVQFSQDEVWWNDCEMPVYVRLSGNHPALSEFQFGFNILGNSCSYRVITDSEEARKLGGESLDFQVDCATFCTELGEIINWVTWSGDEEESHGENLCLIMVELQEYLLPSMFEICYRSEGVDANSHTWKNKNGTDYAEKNLVKGSNGWIVIEGDAPMSTAYVPETYATTTAMTYTTPVTTTATYMPVETYETTTAMIYTTPETTTTTTTYMPMPVESEAATTTTTTYYGETTTSTTTYTTTSYTTTSYYVPVEPYETTTYITTTMRETTTTDAYMPMESGATTTTYYGETTTYTTTSTTTYTTTSTTTYTTTSYTTTSTTSFTTTTTSSTATETTTEEPVEETTTQAMTEEPVETTVTEITEESAETTTTQATTEELVETTTTVMETTEEPVTTTETTPDATEEPTDDLPETGTTGTLPARVAECSALALIIGGTVMILKSRKKEN